MADVHTKELRRKNMQAIRYKNTKPEVLIRQLLHRQGFRFRLNVRKLPGSPDIVLPKYRATVFVNGCFWHGHDCYLFKMPKTRQEFWETKIGGNRARDQRVVSELNKSNWRVLIVWECAVKGRLRQPEAALMNRITAWLHGETTAMDFYRHEERCLDEKLA